MNELQVTGKRVTRAAFVDAARVYIGAAQSAVVDAAFVDERLTGGTPCWGVPMLAGRDLDLWRGDINFSHLSEPMKIAALWRFLRAYGEEIWFDSSTKLRAGDLLLGVWRDVDVARTHVHHLNLWTGPDGSPFGSQLQCVSREHGGTGAVCEVPLNVLDMTRIERVFRLSMLVDEGEI